MKMLCDVYRSAKKPDMYLYVPRNAGLAELPDALLRQFGKAELALTLELTPEKKLARANIKQVLASLNEAGYYLQLPPGAETYMQDINQQNTRLVN